MKKIIPVLFAAALTVGLAGPAFAVEDDGLGKKAFRKCHACHSLEEGKNRMGPSLYGLAGRKAGTAPGPSRGLWLGKEDLNWYWKNILRVCRITEP